MIHFDLPSPPPKAGSAINVFILPITAFALSVDILIPSPLNKYCRY
ncbi:MAG: hypothetical protein AB8U97_06135 [Rickettsia endosymbiont of Haemaphysalis japonica]